MAEAGVRRTAAVKNECLKHVLRVTDRANELAYLRRHCLHPVPRSDPSSNIR